MTKELTAQYVRPAQVNVATSPKKERSETLAVERKASGAQNWKSNRKFKIFIKKLGPCKLDSETSDSNSTIEYEYGWGGHTVDPCTATIF